MEARQAQPLDVGPRERERWAAAHTPRSMGGLDRIPGQLPTHAAATQLALPPPAATPAVPQTLAGDWARIPSDAPRLRHRALAMPTSATPPEATPRSVWPTGPGLGPILRLVRRAALVTQGARAPPDGGGAAL
jgi:hypothetical protein